MTKYAMMFVKSDMGWLCVSRKTDSTKFGLPGGSINPQEDSKSAAIRETFEETGITINDCVLVHSNSTSDYFFATNYSGEISTNEVGIVKWGKYCDLVNENSAFPAENIASFAGLMFSFPEMFLL